MKGFETRTRGFWKSSVLLSEESRPAMKGFETLPIRIGVMIAKAFRGIPPRYEGV